MGILVHLRWYLFLFSLRFSQLHIYTNSLRVLSRSVTSASHPIIRVSSTIPNTFGRPLKILLIFLWNMSAADAAQRVVC